jgi:hypothetical protein
VPAEATRQIWVRRIFWALALLYVIPFWVVDYVPTTDGPCHLYNAWVMHQLDNRAEFPRFAEYYRVNPRPNPNWLTQGTLYLLFQVVPPLLAEKVLLSGYVLLFLGGVWTLAGAVRPEVRWPALLAFPFVFSQIFQMGFYNFSLSLGLVFFTLAYWWKGRDGFSAGFAVKLNFLLLVLWFAHVVSFCLTLFAIGVLWLVTLRRDELRPRLLQIPALLPLLALPVWFALQHGQVWRATTLSTGELVLYLLRLEVLLTFSDVQLWGGALLALFFLALLVLTLAARIVRRAWQWHPEDGFLLLALLVVAIYFLSPAGIGGGSLIKQRLTLYPYLFLIPWLAPRLGKAVRGGLIAALALLAAVNLGYVVYWYDVLGREMEAYLAGLEKAAPNTRLLPLLFDRSSAAVIGPYGHAAGYAAIEKGLIDWDNYSAPSETFPVQLTRRLRALTIWKIEGDPANFPLNRNRREIDYVYTWKMPPEAAIARQLARKYRRIWEGNGGELWMRRDLRF